MRDSLTTDPSSPRFQEETRRHLQRRLRLLAGAVATITGLLLLAFIGSMAFGGTAPARLLPRSPSGSRTPRCSGWSC